MNCGRPDCTGVHDHSRPVAEWCPGVRAKRAATDRHYRESGRRAAATRRYEKSARGAATRRRYQESGKRAAADRRFRQSPTGKAKIAAEKRRRGQTPGTYEYNAAHGIGRPGAVRQFRQRRAQRRQANARDAETLRRLRDGTKAR